MSENQSNICCKYCRFSIPAAAIVCPNCHYIIGNCAAQILIFLRSHAVSHIFIALIGVFVGYLAHPQAILSPTAPLKPFSFLVGQLSYAASIEQMGYYTKVFNWGHGKSIFVARLLVSNDSSIKHNNIKINVIFSNEVNSAVFKLSPPMRDDRNSLIVSPNHFKGQRDISFTIPSLAPKQHLFVLFQFKGDTEIIEASVVANEKEAARTEFLRTFKEAVQNMKMRNDH